MLSVRVGVAAARGIRVGVAAALGVALVVGTAASASAWDRDAGGSSSGGGIAVTITQSSAVGGTPGSSGTSVRTVYVAPVCQYIRYISGKEYAEGMATMGVRYFGYIRDGVYHPYPDYQRWAEDTEGRWYSGMCDGGRWTGSADGFIAFAEAWFDAHEPVYVQAGETPPAGDVPPEVLAQAAYDAMDLPTGVIAWNPRSSGQGATFVGLDTWVWLEDAADHVWVRATLPSGAWAQVDATLDTLSISAPGAPTTTCTGVGVPWSPGATGGCTLQYLRSSANQPVKAGFTVPTSTTTARASWTASWTSSLTAGTTSLPGQTVTATAEVPVAEIETLVTDR